MRTTRHAYPRGFLSVTTSFLLMTLITSRMADAADARPYDYYQHPEGTTLLEIYSDVYASHHLSLSNSGRINQSELMFQVETLETVHYFDVGGIGIAPFLCLQYGSLNHVQTAGSVVNGSTGWGDPLLGTVIAPIHTVETTLGTSFGVHAPLGRYTPGKDVNLGQNRWNGYIQMGGMQHLWNGLSAEFYMDANFYADNAQTGTGHQVLQQETTYQVQPWLRWNFQPTLALAIGYSQSWGGRQSLDGAGNGIDAAAKQVRLGLVHVLTPSLTYTAQLSRDMVVHGGYQSDTLAELRFIANF